MKHFGYLLFMAASVLLTACSSHSFVVEDRLWTEAEDSIKENVGYDVHLCQKSFLIMLKTDQQQKRVKNVYVGGGQYRVSFYQGSGNLVLKLTKTRAQADTQNLKVKLKTNEEYNINIIPYKCKKKFYPDRMGEPETLFLNLI